MKYLPRETAYGKLRAMVQAAPWSATGCSRGFHHNPGMRRLCEAA